MGKTQLLRILAGLTQPDKGAVLIGENQIPVEQGKVGMVAQNYPLFDHRSVLGNIVKAGTVAGLLKKEATEKGMSLLQRFGLEEKADNYPAELSGGQRQRVAIIQQIICSNHFLLLDEPFTGLDPNMVDELCHLLTEVASMDDLNTIILSSHIISSTVMIADTIWMLGRDFTEKDHQMIPGARIKIVHDLLERGLAWHPDIASMPDFGDCVSTIRAQFRTL